MPNCILIMPYIAVLSYIPVLSLQNTKNQLYFAVDYLNAFILIIIPTKLFAVQWDADIIILQVKGFQSVINGTILFIVVTEWLKGV